MSSYAEGFLPEDKDFATRAITTSFDPEQWSSWSVVTPIVLATTYKQISPAEPKKYIYGRSGNPTRDVLQEVVAALEKAKYAVCFASGLGAGCTISYFTKAGDNIIACSDVYGGMYRMFDQVIRESGIDVTFTDMVDISKLESHIKPNTKMIWLETPSNPLLKIIDIEGVCKISRKYKDILVVVDNTFLSPYFQKPLDFGADIVVHSLTKYANGHSDVIMGAAVTNDERIKTRLQFLQNACGIVPSPFDCYLVNRSIKTMAIRMKHHMKSSIQVAIFLEQHPLIQQVIHPGLKSHPQHELAKKQTSGWSGMLSFYLKDAGKDETSFFINKLKIFTLAESLGGFESLIEIPSIMTHASVPLEEKIALGLTDNLVRASIGLESTEDLISDLEQALSQLADSVKATSSSSTKSTNCKCSA